MAINARRLGIYEQARRAIKNARSIARVAQILSDDAHLMRLEQVRLRQEISAARAGLRQSRLSLHRVPASPPVI